MAQRGETRRRGVDGPCLALSRHQDTRISNDLGHGSLQRDMESEPARRDNLDLGYRTGSGLAEPRNLSTLLSDKPRCHAISSRINNLGCPAHRRNIQVLPPQRRRLCCKRDASSDHRLKAVSDGSPGLVRRLCGSFGRFGGFRALVLCSFGAPDVRVVSLADEWLRPNMDPLVVHDRHRRSVSPHRAELKAGSLTP